MRKNSYIHGKCDGWQSCNQSNICLINSDYERDSSLQDSSLFAFLKGQVALSHTRLKFKWSINFIIFKVICSAGKIQYYHMTTLWFQTTNYSTSLDGLAMSWERKYFSALEIFPIAQWSSSGWPLESLSCIVFWQIHW